MTSTWDEQKGFRLSTTEFSFVFDSCHTSVLDLKTFYKFLSNNKVSTLITRGRTLFWASKDSGEFRLVTTGLSIFLSISTFFLLLSSAPLVNIISKKINFDNAVSIKKQCFLTAALCSANKKFSGINVFWSKLLAS